MIGSFQEFIDLVECGRTLRHDSAPDSVWEEVLQRRPDLTRIVSLNKTISESILRLLAKHEDPLVRCDIANVRRLPRDVFELLARDPDESVRARVAWNKKTPEDILKRLAADESPVVNEPAGKRLAK
jgi:hypothetical protein